MRVSVRRPGILLPEALALAEVAGAMLVQTGTKVNPTKLQKGEHHEGAEATVEDGHLSFLQTIQDFAQQSALPGLLAGIGSDV